MAGGICPVCDVAGPARSRRKESAAAALAVLVLVSLATLDIRNLLAPPRATGTHAAAPAAARPTPLTPPTTTAVLEVNAPVSDWDTPAGPSGYAFVVRRTAQWSDLLTDYHLVVDRYLAGDRAVTLSDGVRTLAGHIVEVSPDPHVARIRVPLSLPALPLGRNPAVGDAVAVRAEPRGAELPARVVRHDGAAGHVHLTFSVTVPEGLDGAPVVDGSGAVVGIAEPSSQFATGGSIGFAVPIASACAAVHC